MFVNLETTVLQELINAEADSKWNALVVSLLSTDCRELVVGKLANALQQSIWDQSLPTDPLVTDLYTHALRRVDFFTIALELVQAAETAGTSPVCDNARPMAA